MDELRYKAVPFRAFPIDRVHALLVSPRLDGATTVLGAVPFMLSACLSPRTLDEHEEFVKAISDGADPNFVRTTLERFVRAGLLEPMTERDLRPEPAQPSRSITTVAVLTADRPPMLERCLASYAGQWQTNDQHIRLLVLDGSTTAATAARTRLVTQEAARRTCHEVQYVGPEEIRAFREALMARGVSPALLEFALPDATGPARGFGTLRNLLLLLAIGERALMLEDATFGTLSTGTGIAAPLDIGGHMDPRNYEFFDSREAALPLGEMGGGDLIAAHEALIGGTLADLVEATNGRYDTRRSCGHMRAMLMERANAARVRVTFAGVAGDSGLVCPYRLLFVNGPVSGTLASSQEVFDRALTFRELRRISDRPVITHDASCELHCAALDNTSVLPPFPPIGVEAAAFGVMVALCDPDALFGHVPIAVGHDSVRAPVYESAGIGSASSVGVGDLITALASRAVTSPFIRDPAERVAYLGRHLSAIAAFSEESFAELLRDVVLDRRCRELAHLDQLDAKDAKYPEYWRAAFARYRLAALASVEDPAFFLPGDLIDEGDKEDGLGRTRRFVANFGSLLQSWPDTTNVAQELAPAAACVP